MFTFDVGSLSTDIREVAAIQPAIEETESLNSDAHTPDEKYKTEYSVAVTVFFVRGHTHTVYVDFGEEADDASEYVCSIRQQFSDAKMRAWQVLHRA